MPAHPLILQEIGRILRDQPDSRTLVRGARRMGRTALLHRVLHEARSGHYRIPAQDTHLFCGSNARDIYEELPRALRRPGIILVDDLDKAVGWLSAPEVKGLQRAARSSPAHILATSLQEVPEFLEGASLLHLHPLSRDECLGFYSRVGCPAEFSMPHDLRPEFSAALRAFSGGRPDRLLYIANHLHTRMVDKAWGEVLISMADHYTPEDRQNLDSLCPGQRMIWAALAELARGARWVTAADVAQRRRMTVNHASAYLGRLVEKDVVVSTPQIRGRRYRISDGVSQAQYLVRYHGAKEAGAIAQEAIDRENDPALG